MGGNGRVRENGPSAGDAYQASMDEKEALGAPRAASLPCRLLRRMSWRGRCARARRLMEVGFTAKHLRRIKELLAAEH